MGGEWGHLLEGARIYHFGLSGGPLFGGGRLWVVIRGNGVFVSLTTMFVSKD